MNLLESTTIQLTKQADGFNTSTKVMLERINSNVFSTRIGIGTPDTNYTAYEITVDKLASRVNELETNLKLLQRCHQLLNESNAFLNQKIT